MLGHSFPHAVHSVSRVGLWCLNNSQSPCLLVCEETNIFLHDLEIPRRSLGTPFFFPECFLQKVDNLLYSYSLFHFVLSIFSSIILSSSCQRILPPNADIALLFLWQHHKVYLFTKLRCQCQFGKQWDICLLWYWRRWTRRCTVPDTIALV